ncbi:MAG: bifunctional UDP-sugar hydrolase/5'-nucleotidase [Verrucomicrobiota bacterium]
MNRRHFFTTSLGASTSLLAACQSESQRSGDVSTGTSTEVNGVYEPANQDIVRVSILNTTDLHGHVRPTYTYGGLPNVGGLARCMSQIREWRKKNENHITLDIGDLYQGTHLSLESEGQVMIKLLNAANYDAWVAGNHDFDWGEDVFRNAVKNSSMPVLSNNISVDGFASGDPHHQGGEYANLMPWMIKEFGEIKVGVFGVTTPGLPFWLNSGQLGSVKPIDPLAATQRTVQHLKDLGVNAIIAAGHMGLKDNYDDYANQVNRLVMGCPEIDVYVAGHTHRDRPATLVGNTLFTQAGYHGIWAGKTDLTFERSTGKLIMRDSETTFMDRKVEEDPLALEITTQDIENSEQELEAKVGKLTMELTPGSYNDFGADTQALIGAGIRHAVGKKGEKLDGVLHGTFSSSPIKAGNKSLGDMWKILPYENRIATASLTGEQLRAVVKESFNSGSGKRLVGFKVDSVRDYKKKERVILSIKTAAGEEVDNAKIYRIGFNSYDAQSGGRRLLLLRELLLKPAAKTIYHPIDTRAALTDFFLDKETVKKEHLMG